MRPSSRSNDEFSEAIAALAAKLGLGGNHRAAGDLRASLACFRGLTSGCDRLLESIYKFRATPVNGVGLDEQERIETIRQVIQETAHRK